MKKLLLIALLIVGCGARYEDKGKQKLKHSCAYNDMVDSRFDTWFGKISYKVKGKWYTEKEWIKTDIYKEYQICLDNNPILSYSVTGDLDAVQESLREHLKCSEQVCN